MDFVGEEGGLHLEQLLEQDGVELRDLGDELHAGHQGDVEGVEADYGQALDDVLQLLHILLAQVPLQCIK